MKKLITMQSLTIILIMILQIILPVFPLQTTALAVDGSGTQASPWQIGKTSSDSVEAYIQDTTLYIYGSGEMMSFTSNKPWPSTITKVEIDIIVVLI